MKNPIYITTLHIIPIFDMSYSYQKSLWHIPVLSQESVNNRRKDGSSPVEWG